MTTKTYIAMMDTEYVARTIVRGEHGVKPGQRYRFTNADYERVAAVRHRLDHIAKHLDFDKENLIGHQAVELMDLFNEVSV